VRRALRSILWLEVVTNVPGYRDIVPGAEISKAVLVTGCSSGIGHRGWDRLVRTAYPPPKPEDG
jgi:hypothetical protein